MFNGWSTIELAAWVVLMLCYMIFLLSIVIGVPTMIVLQVRKMIKEAKREAETDE